MSEIELFEPLAGPHDGWPPGTAVERAYLEAFAQEGSTTLIANLRTRMLGLRWRERVFPVTVNDAEYGDSYVALPHTAYALYAKAELRLVGIGAAAPVLGLLADAVGLGLRAARINRIVHLDNWLVSTNLHGDWAGEGLDEIRECLTQQFPGHILAIRSLESWSSAALLERCRAEGWRLLPSRQIYVTDDLARDWAPRRDTRQDAKLLAQAPYQLDPMDKLAPGDAERIAELYRLLYLGRYSGLNPAFTARYIELTHRTGLLRYRGLRDVDGRLVAVVGCWIRDGILTTPIVGYDTSLPVAAGLYRMACLLLSRMALERGARLNSSAGAAGFKRNRGARPVIEYSAFFVEHLSWARRAAIGALETGLNRFLVPAMAQHGW